MAAQPEGPACTPGDGPRRGAPPTCPGRQHDLVLPSYVPLSTTAADRIRGYYILFFQLSLLLQQPWIRYCLGRCPCCCPICSPLMPFLLFSHRAPEGCCRCPCPGVATAAASNRCWCSTTAAWAPAACRSRRPATQRRSWRRTPWRSWYGNRIAVQLPPCGNARLPAKFLAQLHPSLLP